MKEAIIEDLAEGYHDKSPKEMADMSEVWNEIFILSICVSVLVSDYAKKHRNKFFSMWSRTCGSQCMRH